MGSANVKSCSEDYQLDLYAFRVVKYIYELDEISASDFLANEYYQIFNSARLEMKLPIEDCKCVGVTICKYKTLDVLQIHNFHQSVSSAAENRDKNQTNKKSNKSQDYTMLFSGSESDSKNEKEAAEILRGSNGDNDVGEDENVNSFLRKPLYNSIFTLQMLRKCGKWIKFMGGSGCYMYIHVLTKEVLSIKPDDFIEEEEPNLEMQTENVAIDPSNGLVKVSMQGLPAMIDKIINEYRKTPLVIDTSTEQLVRTFYSYKAMLEVCLFYPNTYHL